MPNQHFEQFFIGGQWRRSPNAERVPVVNPSTGEVVAHTVRGTPADVDDAVAAATVAFSRFRHTSVADRIGLLRALKESYGRRVEEVADLICAEMGSPLSLAKSLQAPLGVWHIDGAIDTLEAFAFDEARGDAVVVREAIGVVGMITPWNWPVHQIMSKLAYAVAAGCTSILKPSELAPLNATLVAEAVEEAGFPPGVFNLVTGRGSVIGEALAGHPGVDMISITGSTGAGARVAELAAPTVKRVAQELGGKSANILLDDAELVDAVSSAVTAAFANNGQSCDAPTRLLVPQHLLEEVVAIVQRVTGELRAGSAEAQDTDVGPVVSGEQFDRIQGYIAKGMEEGARLVAGGLGSLPGASTGWIVKPTVFADVTADMMIFREEIFGPVLCVSGYRSVDEAVAMANDSEYGLAAYVSGSDLGRAREVAERLDAGQVRINYQRASNAPFGGYKRSGNGREYGPEGLSEFLETKVISGLATRELQKGSQ